MSVSKTAALGSLFCVLACPVVATENIDEELLVVGSRLPAEPSTVGRAVSVLDETAIRNLGHKYAADLLRFVPGVAVSRSGGYGGLTQLRIRGAESNHSVILLDGIDASAAGSGEFDFSSLLAADIERIEVLRGSQSGLYGSNALGGVINVVTRHPRAGLSIRSELEAGGNRNRHAGLSIAGGTDAIQGRLSYVQRESEFDLSADDSVMGGEADAMVTQTVSGKLMVDLTEQLALQAFGRFTDRQTDTDGFDFSGGPQQGLPVDDNSTSDTQDLTAGVSAILNVLDDRSTTRLTFAWTDTELAGEGFGSESDREQINLDSSWVWPDAADLGQKTTMFVQFETESFKNRFPADPSQVATQKRDLLGYGVEHRMAFGEKLFINGALRFENNDEFENATTFSVDVSYALDDAGSRLHASYGRAVTNPTFLEQFGFVPGTFVGNPSLEPESSDGWDVGISQVLFDSTLRLNVTYFAAELDNEIASSFPTVVNLAGESDRQGVEFVADWQVSDGTMLNVSYTYTDAREPAGREVRRPQHMASIRAAHAFLAGRGNLSAGAVYNGASFDSDFRNFFINGFVAERAELDSYVTLNVNASYNFSEALEVYLRVENLLDEDNADQIGYALPGRTAFAGVRYSFTR
ncbi:MAG: TonB-dependent receptor [bacterium]